ncbi:MAG: HU family DNA-binding protein [Bacteroidota bacterium]
MINIKVWPRKNPRDLEAQEKYYAKAVGNGVTDLRRLARLISNQSTVRKADCLAVLEALQHNISEELAEGKIVRLGDFGTFQVGVRSYGEETPDEVSANSVKSKHLNFRPGLDFEHLLNNIKFKIVS